MGARSVLVICILYVCRSAAPIILVVLISIPNSLPSQYQLALHQIESLRKDGKFHSADGSIPEGQGIVMAHLNECHELIEMVMIKSFRPCA
jgi:hypothetical protein